MAEECETDKRLFALNLSIYAIVAATQEASTSYRILKEYEDMMGEPIPYAQYGFSTVEGLLDKNPKLRSVIRDGKRCYVGVYSDMCGDILNLVARQKKKSKKKGRGGKKGGRGGSSSFQRSYSARAPSNSGFTRNSQFSSSTRGNFARPGYPQFGAPPNFNSPQSSKHVSSNISSRVSFGTQSPQKAKSKSRKFESFDSEFLTSVEKIDWKSNRKVDEVEELGEKILKLLRELSREVYPLQIFLTKFEDKYGFSFMDKKLFKKFFGTTELNKIFGEHGFFSDKLRMSGSRLEDSLIMTKQAALIAAEKEAAQRLEKGEEVPPKKFPIPSLGTLLKNVIQILIGMYPNPIPVIQMSKYYDRRHGIFFDPVKYHSKTWQELFETTFRATGNVHVVGMEVHLTQKYVRNNRIVATSFTKEESSTSESDTSSDDDSTSVSEVDESSVCISPDWNSETDLFLQKIKSNSRGSFAYRSNDDRYGSSFLDRLGGNQDAATPMKEEETSSALNTPQPPPTRKSVFRSNGISGNLFKQALNSLTPYSDPWETKIASRTNSRSSSISENTDNHLPIPRTRKSVFTQYLPSSNKENDQDSSSASSYVATTAAKFDAISRGAQGISFKPVARDANQPDEKPKDTIPKTVTKVAASSPPQIVKRSPMLFLPPRIKKNDMSTEKSSTSKPLISQTSVRSNNTNSVVSGLKSEIGRDNTTSFYSSSLTTASTPSPAQQGPVVSSLSTIQPTPMSPIVDDSELVPQRLVRFTQTRKSGNKQLTEMRERIRLQREEEMNAGQASNGRSLHSHKSFSVMPNIVIKPLSIAQSPRSSSTDRLI